MHRLVQATGAVSQALVDIQPTVKRNGSFSAGSSDDRPSKNAHMGMSDIRAEEKIPNLKRRYENGTASENALQPRSDCLFSGQTMVAQSVDGIKSVELSLQKTPTASAKNRCSLR